MPFPAPKITEPLDKRGVAFSYENIELMHEFLYIFVLLFITENEINVIQYQYIYTSTIYKINSAETICKLTR